MTAKNVCPFCQGQLQATVKVDCDIDDDGEVVRSDNGDFRIYCENDCEEWEDCGGTDYIGWPTGEDVAAYLADQQPQRPKRGEN